MTVFRKIIRSLSVREKYTLRMRVAVLWYVTARSLIGKYYVYLRNYTALHSRSSECSPAKWVSLYWTTRHQSHVPE